MSILAYNGLPGTGKSYGVVENVILPALKIGRTVVTNIPLNLELISENKEFTGSVQQFNTRDIIDNPEIDFFSELPAGCVFVFDEVWRVWKAGLKASNMPESHQAFLAEHRHNVGDDGFTTEIVLVTQDNAQMCKFVRDLIEETYRSSKLTAVSNKYLKWFLKVFFRKKNDSFRIDIYMGGPTGSNPSKKTMIRQIFSSYKPEVYQYYKSHTKSEKVGVEVKADDRANIFKSSFFRYVMPIAIFILIYSIYSVSSYFSPERVHAETVINTEEIQQKNSGKITGKGTANTATSAGSQKESDEPSISKEWRIVGIISPADKERQGYAYLVSEFGNRTIPLEMCKQDAGSPDWICTLGNEIITQYSGLYAGLAKAARFSTYKRSHVANR